MHVMLIAMAFLDWLQTTWLLRTLRVCCVLFFVFSAFISCFYKMDYRGTSLKSVKHEDIRIGK